jgi:hypothetical protein
MTMVGRESELGRLVDLLDRAESATGGVAVVTGEAGIGKTRLVMEWAALAKDRGFVVLAGRAIEGGRSFRPLAQALMEAVRYRPLLESPQVRPFRAALSRILPSFAADELVSSGIDPTLMLGEGVLRLLRAVGGTGTLLLLEDLHWSDPDTVALLDYLSGAVATSAVVVAATACDDAPGSSVAHALARMPGAVHIRLAPLNSADAATLIDQRTAGLGEAQRQAVIKRAEGVPLVIEELLADAAEPSDVVTSSVPRSFAEVVVTRLRRLTSEQRRVLAAAALVDGESDQPEAADKWTPERLIQRIRGGAEVPNLAIQIRRTLRWDLGAAVASHYRRGRAFLVGDAAHRTTPRGATGLNTGIADGHNLGWKLAWVVRGWADVALLDSYEAERVPVGRRNAARSIDTATGSPPESALAADFGVTYDSAIILDGNTEELPPDEIGLRAQPGQRAPHAWVVMQGRRSSTIDLFDSTLTLFAGPSGGAWRAAAAWLPDGPPLQALGVGTEIADPSGELTERYGLAGEAAVLVRPDGYVAWRGMATDDDAVETLRRAVAQSLGQSMRSADRLPSVA